MNDQERDELRQSLSAESLVSGRSTVKWILVWLAGLVFLALLAAGLIALKPHPVVGGLAGGLLATLAIICIYAIIALSSSCFHWRRVSTEFRRDTLPSIKKTLEEGKVHSQQVVTSEVIEITEFEDEGSGYIFDLGEGKSLLLKGQRYFPVQDTMPWPASEFEIIRSADKNLWIGLFSTGKALVPRRIISMNDCSDDFAWSEREDILTGNPEAVLQSLLKTVPPGKLHTK